MRKILPNRNWNIGEESILPTPVQRVDTKPIEQADQPQENENIRENNDNDPSKGNTRYPTRIRNKPRHLDEYVLDNNVNYTVDYCYRVANIPTMYDEAVN